MKIHIPSHAPHRNVLRALPCAAIVPTALLGLLLAAPSGAFATTLCVSTTSATPQPPYGSWATAAQNIQDAIDAAQVGDTVLVNDGVYAVGGRAAGDEFFMNRAAIDRAITVKSVNGPGVTVIDGTIADRCVYLGSGALLSGFTLTRGSGGVIFGGGVWCEADGVVTNCAISGNAALFGGGGAFGGTLYNCTLTHNGADAGGGALECTLYNCTLTGNVAEAGGGAFDSTLYNCTLIGNGSDISGGGTARAQVYNSIFIGNSAAEGGGAFGGTLYNCVLANNLAGYGGAGASDATLYNCTVVGNIAAAFGGGGVFGGGVVDCTVSNSIVYYNSAPEGPNYDGSSTFDHSCTTPLPSSGVGNIAQEPGFVDLAGGNYRLRITSPCINAGLNQDWMVGATDLDGNPRISWGTVDMGAYEFLLPSSGPWKNHGQYVSTVAHVAAQFVARGLITHAQADAFVSAAANSNIGNHKRK